MELQELEKYLQLGGVFILSVFVIYNFFQLLKDKQTNEKNKNDKNSIPSDVDFILERFRIIERFSIMENKLVNFEKRFESFETRVETHLKELYAKIETLFKETYKK